MQYRFWIFFIWAFSRSVTEADGLCLGTKLLPAINFERMNIRRFQRIERFDRHGSLLFYLQFQREDEGQSTGGGGRDASTQSQRWLDQYPGDGPSEAAAAESTVEIKKLRAHLGQPDCVIEGDMTACSQVPDIMVVKKAKDICFANEVEIKSWLKRKADDPDDPDDPDD